MTTGSNRRSRRAARHQPSSAELRTAEQILKKLTPSPDAYREYRAHVDDYRTLARAVLQLQHPRIITGFRMRRSKLFDDRQYLTAFVLDDFHRVENPRLMTDAYFDRVLEIYDDLADAGPMD